MLESYTYDANGNRGGRTYADDDRMTGTHVYDAAGFLVSRGADTFTLQRPRRAEDGDGRRPDGRLRVRRVAAQARRARAGGVRTEFLYGDPSQPVPRHGEPRRRRAHAVLLRPQRPAVRARARRRALLRRHRPGGHAARGHRRRRGRGEDVRRPTRSACATRRPRPARSSSRSASRAASRTRSPASCASACATTSRPRAASPRGPDPARGRHEPVRVRRQRPGRQARPVRHGRGRRRHR